MRPSSAIVIAITFALGGNILSAQAPQAPAPAVAAQRQTVPIREFKGTGFEFAFLAFENKVTVGPEFVTIGGKDTTDQGGALVNGALSFTGLENATPYVIVRPGADNQADSITLLMADTGGTSARFTFSLKDLPKTEFTKVFATDGATLASPESTGNEKQPEDLKLDLANISQWQIQGNWRGQQLDVALKGVYLTTDVPQSLIDARAKAQVRKEQEAKRQQAEREAKEKRIAELLANAPHPADGARVVNVAPVDANLLAIQIQSREYQYGGLDPYTAQPDDKLTDGQKEWVARDGKLAEEIVGQKVQRKGADGKMVDLGTIAFDHKWVLRPDHLTGTDLETVTMEMPEAYTISSADDAAYATPAAPAKIYRKSKPNSPSTPNGLTVQHHVYLQLASPLKEGAHYTISFKGLNTRDASIEYVHNPRAARSEAVHASHVGYDPAAPFKRAYLSIWLGTGGGHEYPTPPSFEVIDAKSGRAVFTGQPQLAKKLGQPDQLPREIDLSKTAVYSLDFSDFKTPGEYKVYVAGIGTSYPFRIANDVWASPFLTSLKGILAQRSSIELGPPFLEFRRPRPYHPDDGVKFYQIDIGVDAGQEGGRGERLVELWKRDGRLQEVTGVWGGYQDAGDWDSYTTTLRTAHLLTEAFEISPEYTTKLKLTLPGNESQNNLPDLLDEALWGLSFFKRIQLPDGGVRDGFGDGWGVRPGDLSWNNSNPVCVYAARVPTSYQYAGAAAKMSRLLAAYDKAMADEYQQSAIKAWNWAEAKSKEKADDAGAKSALNGDRAFGAVELYWLTRDAAYHEAFKQSTELHEDVPADYSGGWIEPMKQQDATFSYARLPDELADRTLKANARKRYELAGKIARHFMQANAFNLVTAYPGIPCGDFLGYFTSPGGIINVDVVRAHYLSGKAEDLAAVVASTNSSFGANPRQHGDDDRHRARPGAVPAEARLTPQRPAGAGRDHCLWRGRPVQARRPVGAHLADRQDDRPEFPHLAGPRVLLRRLRLARLQRVHGRPPHGHRGLHLVLPGSARAVEV